MFIYFKLPSGTSENGTGVFVLLIRFLLFSSVVSGFISKDIYIQVINSNKYFKYSKLLTKEFISTIIKTYIMKVNIFWSICLL